MRYHLFKGSDYYPDRALGDYKGSFDNEDEARAEAYFSSFSQDWWEIVVDDGDRLRILDSGRYQ